MISYVQSMKTRKEEGAGMFKRLESLIYKNTDNIYVLLEPYNFKGETNETINATFKTTDS